MGKYDDKPYAVGKGKPPVANRWKSGQSGNPRGPRRKAKAVDQTLVEMLAKVINEEILVTKTNHATGNTVQVRMPIREAIVNGLVRDAANGTPAQRDRALRHLMKMGAMDLRPTDRQDTPEKFAERVREFLEKLAASSEEEGYIERESKDPQDPGYNRFRSIG